MALGCWVPHFREHKLPAKPLPWMWIVPMLVTGAWGAAGLGFLSFWRRRGWRFPLGLAWLGLAGAAGLAVAVSAAQLLPVLEFTQRTSRAAEGGPHDIYPFSLEPARLAGLIWPNVLGNAFDGNTSWSELVRPPGSVAQVWVPSIYLGGLTLVLALGTLAFRRAAPWRVWLTIIVLISVCGSLGEYTSPIWAVRALAEGRRPYSRKLPDHNPGPREITIDMAKVSPTFRPLIRELGPLDPDDTTPVRQDDFLRDGDGSLYWLMTTVLPGFRQFRYPAKLFTLTSLGLAGTRGHWVGHARPGRVAAGDAGDRDSRGDHRPLAGRGPDSSPGDHQPVGATNMVSIYGPSDPRGAYDALARGLGQGAVVLGLGLIAIRLAGSRPRTAGLLALLVTTADLGLANRRFVLTVPQSAFETKPEVLRLLEEAERADPSPGPYRIHRLPSWDPIHWSRTGSPTGAWRSSSGSATRSSRSMASPWVLSTRTSWASPSSTSTSGTTAASPARSATPICARVLNVAIGNPIVYFPRRSFDMWNARYFVVPMWPNGWNDSFRGYASMLLDSETIYPRMSEMQGPGGEEKAKEWYEKHDFRVLRNRSEHPRAWVVHRAQVIDPTYGLDAGTERQKAMLEICYEDDPLWSDNTLQAFDPHRVVWIDRDQRNALIGYLPGNAPLASESVKVSYPSPQTVELDVELKSAGDGRPGGHRLSRAGTDDRRSPAPIYPVNRAMRGAAVKEGPHHLVYTYSPRSFRVGLVVSAAGLAVDAGIRVRLLACVRSSGSIGERSLLIRFLEGVTDHE